MSRAETRKPGPEASGAVERRRFTISGVVQGVGFRPFVHRLAAELKLTGSVGNDARAVFAEVQGPHQAVKEFASRLVTDAPPLALLADVRAAAARVRDEAGFRIVTSTTAAGTRTLVSPDSAPSDDCLRELFDGDDRRYRHPFITCTNCGPCPAGPCSSCTKLPWRRLR